MKEISKTDGILTNSRIFRQLESERVKLISDQNEMRHAMKSDPSQMDKLR